MFPVIPVEFWDTKKVLIREFSNFTVMPLEFSDKIDKTIKTFDTKYGPTTSYDQAAQRIATVLKIVIIEMACRIDRKSFAITNLKLLHELGERIKNKKIKTLWGALDFLMDLTPKYEHLKP